MYNSTPETAQGETYLYSLNGKSEGGGGDTPATQTHGTADAPVALSEVLSIINALEDGGVTDDLYYVGGTITTIKTSAENIAKYKNIDYIISDGTNEITVFRGKNLNNTDFTKEGEINVGDQVVVLGKLQKYVNANSGAVVPEIAQGNYIVKLNSTGGGTTGGDDNTGTGTSTSVGTVSGNTISFAMADFGQADATELGTLTLVDGTQITFAQNEGKNPPKYYTVDTSARMYALNSVSFKASKTISKVVINCVSTRTGNEQLYAKAGDNNATVEKSDTSITITNINGTSVNVVNDYTGNSGGTQIRFVSVEITY